jgi:hypothetical protein
MLNARSDAEESQKLEGVMDYIDAANFLLKSKYNEFRKFFVIGQQIGP